jgi:hypothetical protein
VQSPEFKALVPQKKTKQNKKNNCWNSKQGKMRRKIGNYPGKSNRPVTGVLQNRRKRLVWWYIPVIPDTNRRIIVQSQHRQKKLPTPYFKEQV